MSNEMQPVLFPGAELALPAATAEAVADGSVRTPRLNKPERLKGEMRFESLEERLDSDHSARLVWRLVEGLDRTEYVSPSESAWQYETSNGH